MSKKILAFPLFILWLLIFCCTILCSY